MTHLRKMMLEELERRNYAQTTIDCYIQTIEDFARHFRRSPDQLTPEHIREYQAYLFRERKPLALQNKKILYHLLLQVPWGLEALNGTISEPAWKTKPSWYLLTTEDKMIPPDAQ